MNIKYVKMGKNSVEKNQADQGRGVVILKQAAGGRLIGEFKDGKL